MKSLGAQVATDDDEIILPKKSKTSAKGRTSVGGGSRTASAPMRKLMRITCAVGIALGGVVTLVGVMGVVGFVTDNIWVRLVLGLLLVVGLPAFLADRLLKRSDSTLATRGGIGMVADVFAIVLLGVALVLVAADGVTKGIYSREGDRYARSGSTAMARLVYFIGGVSPVFPSEKAAGKGGPAASGSASASGSTSAAPPPPR
jgi:hypothetical protein